MLPPRIYNLFPRLAGTLNNWPQHAERAARMGFDWIFLNPVSQPGFSGSLYAVLEHDQVCTDFLPPGSSVDGMDELAGCLAHFKKLGLRPMMDLVINHTAIDSPLVKSHRDWYRRDEKGEVVRPSAIDPADARNVTVWGDLAEIDNEDSPDRQALWDYWRALVRSSLDLGFRGFRCDAAYKVPAALWRILVDEARAVDPDVRFFAETLGCRLEEVTGLKQAGLDYLFNSSKYWNFDSDWAVSQHAQFGSVAPSVSFPESHDTPRLMEETGGNQAVQRQRFLLAAVFSEGLMMPIGFEYGFQGKLDVVQSRPEHWEETGLDFCPFIRAVNALKTELAPLAGEGTLRTLTPYDRPTLILEKSIDSERMWILINKDWNRSQCLDLDGLALPPARRFIRLTAQGERRQDAPGSRVELDPAEIALIV